MANILKTNQKKDRKRRFYKRKGFWLTLLVLMMLGLATAGVAFRYVENYTRKYRLRADTTRDSVPGIARRAVRPLICARETRGP